MIEQPPMVVDYSSPDELRRERRRNEWIRSMSLNPYQQSLVQQRMLANPNDIQANTRMELANQTLPRHSTSSWNDSMNAANAWAQQTQAMDSERAARAQRASQTPSGGGMPITTGEVNGLQVVVPTAGNYNAFREALARGGFNEGSDPSQVLSQQGMYSMFASPDQKMANSISQQRVDAMRYSADQQVAATRAKADNAMAVQKEKSAGALAAARVRAQNPRSAPGRSQSLKDPYGLYLQSFNNAARRLKDQPAENLAKALRASGIQFKLVPMPDGSTQVVPVGQSSFVIPGQVQEMVAAPVPQVASSPVQPPAPLAMSAAPVKSATLAPQVAPAAPSAAVSGVRSGIDYGDYLNFVRSRGWSPEEASARLVSAYEKASGPDKEALGEIIAQARADMNRAAR